MPIVPKTMKHAQEFLQKQLYSLCATGTNSFEGFMAKALTELTGQAFYVVKSGSQGGSDVRSNPCNFFKVGLEGKRYQPSTRLSLDGLLHKITDASTERVPADLWILAATRQIDISDREKLDAHGEACGIGVVVLDWPNNLAQICDSAVICASASQTCQAFLNSPKPLAAALELIRQNPEFESAHQRILDQLMRADTGYESTRCASERWMEKAQASLANAKSHLGGHHNLGESEYGVIRRTAVNDQLDAWHDGGQGVVALLGDEGMGKSWAALDWYNQVKSSESGAPLTIFLSAKEASSSDVKSILSKALYDQTRIRSVEFWKKRLALWERSGRGTVPILILLDGLNENFQFTRWAEWLQPLFEDDVCGMYRVIVSCWPNWWHGSLDGLANLTPIPLEITVAGFNDGELDALLKAMGVDRSEFPRAVPDLMRVPRLSSLVVKNRDKLNNSGDVTAERVIYEDWKDRISRRGHVGLNDPEMKEFVAELGSKLRMDIDKASVTRKDVIDILSMKSGKSSIELLPAVTELTSGAWLKPGDKPYTFRVAADRIPFVLGIALMSQIRDETEITAIEASIAKFLDPLKAHSLGTAILRAATTVALIEADTSLVLRQTLLHRWLGQENFHSDDFDAFWRLAVFDPNLFLDLAESSWLASEGRYFTDEVMIKTFANATEFPEFRETLIGRLTKWLGTAWPDPKVGAVLGNIDQTQEDSKQRAAKTRSRYTDWISSAIAKSFAPIQLDDSNAKWSWLSARALAILSYAKRAPFTAALEAWALSRAIMGWMWPRHGEEMAWVLRLNPDDSSETTDALQGIILRLKAQGHPTCEQAAAYLIDAMSHVERASDPMTIDKGPQEDSPTPLDIAIMDTGELYEAAQRYLSPSGWERYAPEIGEVLINTLVERGLDGNENALALLIDNLDDLLITLTPDSRDRLQETINEKHNAIKNGDETSERAAAKLQAARLTLQLYGAKPADQSTLVLSNGLDAGGNDRWLPIYRHLALPDVAETELAGVPADLLAAWLDYTGRRLQQEEIAKLDFLPDLILHGDQKVRHSALGLAAWGRHMPALMAFAASPYAAAPSQEEEPDREHEYWRNWALLEYCAYTPDTTTSKLLSPESAALIAEEKTTDPEALDEFNRYLRGEFEAVTTPTSWSSSRYWRCHKEAVEALIEHDLHGVLEWLEPWLENLGSINVGKALLTHFPVVDTMRALSKKAPQISLKLYEVLTDQGNKNLFFVDRVLLFPFEVPSPQQVDSLCDRLLTNATTDKALMEIVCAAHKHNRLDWLLDRIKHLERSATPADVAQAYTLLGMCHESHHVDGLWEDFLARPPRDGWLDGVLKASFRDYTRNSAALDALESFWSSNKNVARHTLKRIEDTCDMRMAIWFNNVGPEQHERPYEHNLALSLSVTALSQASKRDRDHRKKELYHTPLAFSTMAPWK